MKITQLLRENDSEKRDIRKKWAFSPKGKKGGEGVRSSRLRGRFYPKGRPSSLGVVFNRYEGRESHYCKRGGKKNLGGKGDRILPDIRKFIKIERPDGTQGVLGQTNMMGRGSLSIGREPRDQMLRLGMYKGPGHCESCCAKRLITGTWEKWMTGKRKK